MARKKHLMVVHGRSTKPSEKEKTRIVTLALMNGLNRVDPGAAAKIGTEEGQVNLSFIYYGDLSNQLIVERNPDKLERLQGQDSDHGNQRCEAEGFYNKGLAKLFEQEGHDEADYKAFLKKYDDRRWVDNAASVVSFLGNLAGLSDHVIAKATADMGAYLLTRRWGSAIRDRLQRPLKEALLNGDDICLVSHSMGCIVSYDVLWKFSRMSEYREVQAKGNRVTKWFTLGNPLGEPGVRKNLYDSDEPKDGKYPKDIIKEWVNFSAQDDFICHDATVEDDFKQMIDNELLSGIRDEKIYNFWIGAKATNPHKFYGYLDNPIVAGEIVDWMNSP